MPPLCSRLQCDSVLTASPAECVIIASNSIPTRRRWCGACPHVSCHNFPVIRSPSLAHLFVLSTLFETRECSSTMTSERLVMFGEPCHSALLRFASSVTFVDTSPTTASAFWWCRLCTQHSTTATSSWSGFLFIYSGASSLFSTLRLVWYFHYVVTTVSRTPFATPLAASTTTCWLQGGCHGVSGATGSHATIPESAGSCRRPAQSLPTSVSFLTPTARATIPANNWRSTDISSCCITLLELIAIRLGDIQAVSCLSAFCQRLKTFLFRQSFPDIILWSQYALVVYATVLLF